MTTHDIYIYPIDKGKSGGIQIPWLPSSVEFDTGGMRVSKYDILRLGEVNIPDGSNLGTISFTSVFPGEARRDLPFLRGSYSKPETYQRLLESWLTNGTKLKVIMTGTPINHDVYLDTFVPTYNGAFGDINYSLSLKCRRDIAIKTVSKPKPPAIKSKTSTSSSRTHTVKSGDTLWGISGKYLGKGSRYKEIYNLNKSIIESTAKRHGFKSSSGGHWIFPGTKLKIPAK